MLVSAHYAFLAHCLTASAAEPSSEDPRPLATDTPSEVVSPTKSTEAVPPDPPISAADKSDSSPAAGPPIGAKFDVSADANRWVPHGEAEKVAAVPVAADKLKFTPGKGLNIESKDKRFAIQLHLRGQIRYTLDHDGFDRTTEHELQVRRARVAFKGHFFGEHNKFKMQLAIAPRDMGFKDGVAHHTPLLDWYLEFDKYKSFVFRVGQYVLPFSRQRSISSANLQMVDRSITEGEFNLDRDIGFDISAKDFLGWGKLRYYAGVYMGEGRDLSTPGNFELLYLGRVEVMPLGMFDDYSEADFERSPKPKLALGAAYAFHDGAKKNHGILGNAPSDGGTTDYHSMTADALMKVAGFTVTGQFFYRQGKRKYGPATVLDDAGNEVNVSLEYARTGLGWFAQSGYLIPRIPLEIVARYGQIRKVGSTTSAPDQDELGASINWYFARHSMKLQLDYFRLWNDKSIDNGTDEVRLQLSAGF